MHLDVSVSPYLPSILLPTSLSPAPQTVCSHGNRTLGSCLKRLGVANPPDPYGQDLKPSGDLSDPHTLFTASPYSHNHTISTPPLHIRYINQCKHIGSAYPMLILCTYTYVHITCIIYTVFRTHICMLQYVCVYVCEIRC